MLTLKHFPKTEEQLRAWTPIRQRRALAMQVLAVAITRVEGTWSAYIAAVAGQDHKLEQQAVLEHGDKLWEGVARAIFPLFEQIPYAP